MSNERDKSPPRRSQRLKVKFGEEFERTLVIPVGKPIPSVPVFPEGKVTRVYMHVSNAHVTEEMMRAIDKGTLEIRFYN